MRSRKERRLFPKPEPTERRWFGASVVVHAIAMVLLVAVASRTFLVERTVTLIPLDTVGIAIVFPSASPNRVSRQTLSERTAGPAQSANARARDTAADVVPVVQVPVAVLPPPPKDTAGRRPAAPRADQGRRPASGGRTDTAAAPIGTHRRLGPGLGNGRLWDEARRFARDMLRAGAAGVTRAGEVATAQPLDSAQRRQMMDSVVKERLRTFMAALPYDSMAAPKAQKWTTEIDGKTWGMDGSWIYLGDLKIPTAILALLPLPSGNYDQAQQAKSLQYMRDDILQAAQRAQNNADFQRYLKEERTRHDAERAAERARGVVRDTVIKQ